MYYHINNETSQFILTFSHVIKLLSDLFLGRWMGKGENDKKVIEGANMIKVYYMHVWKCHDETSYYVQFNICQ
jgi:hypothetical protein